MGVCDQGQQGSHSCTKFKRKWAANPEPELGESTLQAQEKVEAEEQWGTGKMRREQTGWDPIGSIQTPDVATAAAQKPAESNVLGITDLASEMSSPLRHCSVPSLSSPEGSP